MSDSLESRGVLDYLMTSLPVRMGVGHSGTELHRVGGPRTKHSLSYCFSEVLYLDFWSRVLAGL